jgi:hypothetical protein
MVVFTDYEDFSRHVLEGTEKADPPPGSVVVDCDAICEPDTTGSGALHDLHGTPAGAGIRRVLARLEHDVLEYLRRDGVPTGLGGDAVHPTVPRR